MFSTWFPITWPLTGALLMMKSSCVLFFCHGLMAPTGELATPILLHNVNGWKHAYIVIFFCWFSENSVKICPTSGPPIWWLARCTEVWQEAGSELLSLLNLAISVTFNVINRVQLYESSRRGLHIKVINASCYSLWQQGFFPPTEGKQHILQTCHSFQPFQPFFYFRLWEILGLFIPVPLDPSEMLTVSEVERPVSGSCWRLRALKHFWKVIFKRGKKEDLQPWRSTLSDKV